MENNELKHYGVLGMKWGIRRYQNKDVSLTSNGRKRYQSEDSKKTQQIKKKKISEMSNQELKDANYRLNLEKNYKELTRHKNAGQKIIKSIISLAGTIAALEGAAKTYERVGKKVVDNILSK